MSTTYYDNLFNELIIDNFAGGGGASIGIELAVGRPVDIAINHDADAIAMHKANHPFTKHYQEDVFAINPETVTGGRPVGIAWFSPDCRHFSKAKGDKPVEKKIRGLSWVVLKWAMSDVAPRCIFLENVEEIQTWGPTKKVIDSKGNEKEVPDESRKGETFNGFIALLTTGLPNDHPAFLEACEFLKLDPLSSKAQCLSKGLGYKVDYRVIKACDVGAPTIRKRFYLVARNDGAPIVFPEATHGIKKGLKPYRTAAECIDWSIPCPSIFGRKKELAENTLRRIARGLDKFVIKNPKPYILEMNFDNAFQDIGKPMSTQTTANHYYLIEPSLVTIGYGERQGQQARVNSIRKPLTTVVSTSKQGLSAPLLIQYHSEQSTKEVRGQRIDEPIMNIDGSPRYAITAANIVHYYGGADHASKADSPLPTVTTLPRHYLTESHLCILRNNMDCRAVDEPLPTITAKAAHEAQVVTYFQKIDGAHELYNWDKVRELLNKYSGYQIADDEILIVEINRVPCFIADIGMRMLKAKELMLAQGFPEDYVIDIEQVIGKRYSEAKQIARLGNAVCPPVATALIRANVPELSSKKVLRTCADLDRAIARV